MTVAPLLVQRPLPLPSPVVRRARTVWGGALCGLVALTLVGCGGGESYTPSVTTPGTTTPAGDSFPIVINAESLATMRRGQLLDSTTGALSGPEYGDTWMYQWINKTAGTGFYSTHYLSTLDKTTQLYSHTVTFSDTQPYQTRDFGSKNQTLATSFENTRCQDNTQTRSPFPRRTDGPASITKFAVGNTWTYVWSETCLNGTVATSVTKSVTGRINALETKNLGLLGQGGVISSGTTQRAFQTARYTATRVETSAAGSWTYQDTCWHDIEQDRTVQCDTTASYIPAGGAATTQVYEQSQTLAFVREVRTASPVRLSDGPTTVAMYAGRWEFKLVGAGGTVTCTNMEISLTGNIAGNCTRVVTNFVTRPDPDNANASLQVPVHTTTAFKVSGSVKRGTISTRAADVITVVADSGTVDLSMTGEMLSPISAAGTSRVAASAGSSSTEGTWTARHL